MVSVLVLFLQTKQTINQYCQCVCCFGTTLKIVVLHVTGLCSIKDRKDYRNIKYSVYCEDTKSRLIFNVGSVYRFWHLIEFGFIIHTIQTLVIFSGGGWEMWENLIGLTRFWPEVLNTLFVYICCQRFWIQQGLNPFKMHCSMQLLQNV